MSSLAPSSKVRATVRPAPGATVIGNPLGLGQDPDAALLLGVGGLPVVGCGLVSVAAGLGGEDVALLLGVGGLPLVGCGLVSVAAGLGGEDVALSGPGDVADPAVVWNGPFLPPALL